MDRDRSGTVGVDRECARGDFLRLCENQHPATGETLTQRFNTLRMDDGKQTANRRVFYDFTFSPPKSVSVVALVGADERIIAAHKSAVRLALKELELFSTTRIRTDGGNRDRSSGNIAAALFTHA